MKTAADDFETFISNFEFSPLETQVISNVTALPYIDDDISSILSKQIMSSVNWVDTVRLLMGENIIDYEEVGSDMLTKMVTEIKKNCTPIPKKDVSIKNKSLKQTIPNKTNNVPDKNMAIHLGSESFRKTYGVKYAYVTGAMYRGIASKELVVLMGKAKILAFLGTGGLSLQEIENNLKFIQQELKEKEPYGVNLIHNITDPDKEMDSVKLYLKYKVKTIEAAAFMQMTMSIVYYRIKGLGKDEQGNILCNHKIIAKVSRPEVAEAFMKPPPERIVNKLLNLGLITEEQAFLSKGISMCDDICVGADSGGHTDRGVSTVLLPAIQSLRNAIDEKYSYKNPIRIGLAGGIGTPQAVACAFVMGADFVLTGSINQCTVEAGISDEVKDLLQKVNVQDTDYAPAGDMFEIGAKVQVLKKGVLFATRANKLYALYQQYENLENIPQKTIQNIENQYFKKPIASVWNEVKAYHKEKGADDIIRAAENEPKKKMALIFRWYFGYSSRLSFEGNIKEKVNFQVHTGPALGAFNQWVKGTELENWKNRHSDNIAIKMMEEAMVIMKENLSII